MKTLNLGNFYVKDVKFGPETKYEDHVLSINKEEALAFIQKDEHITSCDIYIAKPGDRTRIVPIKEAAEPRVRVDGRTLFPGVTGPVVTAGEGDVHCLKGVSVLGVGQHMGSFGDGLVDMFGEGQKYTLFGQMLNICIVADTDELSERHEQQKKNHAIRWATHHFAEYLGQTVKDQEPEDVESFTFAPVTKPDEALDGLPKVVLVMQPQSQMEEMGYNDLIYGWDLNHYVPTFMNPNEILDGALISGSFMPCSSKWSTYDMQNFPTIRELYKEHGKSLNFLGVILSNLNVSLEQKERSAIFVANLAQALGADGAIVTEEGYGNPDTDYTRCIVALEDVGVKTVGISNECTGRDGASQPLVVMDEKADALVSTGNVSTLLELEPADLVIGELAALGRDGLSGGWADDEKLGPSVREDGSIIMENNSMFCGDGIAGWSVKTMREFYEVSVMKKAVLYINQFFGGIGGEAEADARPQITENIIGPGLAFKANLKEAELTHIIICGDNYMGTHTDAAVAEILEMLADVPFDVFLAGPAFQAGRYGVACGTICEAVKKAYPEVLIATSMHPENPGVEMFKQKMPIFIGGHSAASMRKNVQAMAKFIDRQLRGEASRGAELEGYFGRGIREQVFLEDPIPAAQRGVAILLKKLAGEPFKTELVIPKKDTVPPAEALQDLSKARIAIMTTGGIVPAANPDHIQSASATRWGRYDMTGLDRLPAGAFKTIHAGFDPAAANNDPNLIVPLDVLRKMEKEGVFKELHPYFYSTVGTGTTQAEATRMGDEMVEKLQEGQVDGVLLVST